MKLLRLSQEDCVSETAQMSWGDFKPLLADAVSNLTSVLQCSMYRLLASPPIVLLLLK